MPSKPPLSMNLRGRMGVPPVQHLCTPRLDETGETLRPTRFMGAMRENLFRRDLSSSDGAREKTVIQRICLQEVRRSVAFAKSLFPLPIGWGEG